MTNSLAIKKLIRNHGSRGLGIYSYTCMLLEENGDAASYSDLVETVVADLHEDSFEVEDILNNPALFDRTEEDEVTVHRVEPEPKKDAAYYGRIGAAKRWGNDRGNDRGDDRPTDGGYNEPMIGAMIGAINPIASTSEARYDDLPPALMPFDSEVEKKEEREERIEESEVESCLSPHTPYTGKDLSKEDKKEDKEERKDGQRSKILDCYTSDFETAWELYGKRGAKLTSARAWAKLSDEEKEDVIKAIPYLVESTPEIRYRPHFSTYLNQRRWEDVVMDEKGKVLYDPAYMEGKRNQSAEPVRTYFGGRIPQ